MKEFQVSHECPIYCICCLFELLQHTAFGILVLCMNLVIRVQYCNYSHFTSTDPILQASYFSPVNCLIRWLLAMCLLRREICQFKLSFNDCKNRMRGLLSLTGERQKLSRKQYCWKIILFHLFSNATVLSLVLQFCPQFYSSSLAYNSS